MKTTMATASCKPARSKLIKLAVIGDKQVGKTSLISRYVHGSYSPHYTYTQGGDIENMDVTINNSRVHLKLVDAAGHKYVRSLIKTLYSDVQGIMVVFDVTREATFDSIQEWLKQIELVNTHDPVIFLVGNKQDLTSFRSVPQEQAEVRSDRMSLPYFETSAKTGQNVHDTFVELLRAVWQRLTQQNRYSLPESITISKEEHYKEDNSCCSIT